MLKTILLLLTFTTINCFGQSDETWNPKHEILQLSSEQGNIIYSSISNNIYYQKWPNDTFFVKFIAKENCKLVDNGYYLTVSPDEKAKNVIIERVFSDSSKRLYVFKVKELPEPRLYFNIETEVEKQKLPNVISKSELKNLYSLEALTEIGNLSWINFEIIEYEIMIIKKAKKNIIFKNIGSIMTKKNQNLLSKIESEDILIFRNIVLNKNGSINRMTINEKSITVK